MKHPLQKAADTWLQSRNIIIEALDEIYPHLRRSDVEQNAAAIIARLARAGLLICTPEDMKD